MTSVRAAAILRLEPNLGEHEVRALVNDDEAEITAVFGYPLARCPDGKCACLQDAAWGHPCDRDEHGEYECMRIGGSPPVAGSEG